MCFYLPSMNELVDINKLVYLQAVVKETLRLYPTRPVSGPREFTKELYIRWLQYPSRYTIYFEHLWTAQGSSYMVKSFRISAREVLEHPQGYGCEGSRFWAPFLWWWKKVMPWHILWPSNDTLGFNQTWKLLLLKF